jgi:hypothetical protein
LRGRRERADFDDVDIGRFMHGQEDNLKPEAFDTQACVGPVPGRTGVGSVLAVIFARQRGADNPVAGCVAVHGIPPVAFRWRYSAGPLFSNRADYADRANRTDRNGLSVPHLCGTKSWPVAYP